MARRETVVGVRAEDVQSVLGVAAGAGLRAKPGDTISTSRSGFNSEVVIWSDDDDEDSGPDSQQRFAEGVGSMLDAADIQWTLAPGH